MGRDWYWGGKSSGGGATAVKKDKEKEKQEVDTRQNPGCMSGVLHLFDFHQFQFPMTQPPCFKPSGLQDYPTSAKGVNAPRNSLESNEGVDKEVSVSETKQKDFDLDISVETAHVKTRTDDQLCCSDSSSSPGPKTPSLVARLMGLDILPDSASSSSSPASVRLNKVQVQTKKQKMNSAMNEARFENSGSRSLPDTPRISSARRSDVDARHSLQIFRENVPSSGELDHLGRIKDQKSRKWELRNDEENRSPGHYARQIVKQVKESVSRRVGLLDITNTTTTTNNNARVKPKEVDVVILKPKKPKRESNLNRHTSSSSSPSSYSSRLRLLEERKNIKVQESSSPPPPPPLSSSQPPPPPPTRSILSQTIKTSTNVPKSRKPKLPHVPQQQKCKKASCERFTQQRRETTTCSSAPSASTSSSCNDVQGSKPGSRLSSSPSRAAPALLHHRVQQQDTFADEIRYVSEILKCTGIHRDTLVSFTRWYSPSHPLDPAVFAYLEKFESSAVKIRSNRKLMFDLTDELLVSFVRPYLNMRPWRVGENRFLHNRREMFGEQLMQHLCYEISKCPSSNCQTLEDIDDLIDRDMPRMRTIPIHNEIGNVAFEIERDILDTLVHETAAEVIQLRVK